MDYLWIVITALFVLNIAMTVYFFNKFEKMFIIMKAGSLKDLLQYYKAINQHEEDEENDDDMP